VCLSRALGADLNTEMCVLGSGYLSSYGVGVSREIKIWQTGQASFADI